MSDDSKSIYERPYRRDFKASPRTAIQFPEGSIEIGKLNEEQLKKAFSEQKVAYVPSSVFAPGERSLVIATVFKLGENKGRGVYAANEIPKNTVLCEYTGAPVNVNTDYKDHDYIYDSRNSENAGIRENAPVVVDAQEHGNVGRYFNHSQTPNCAFNVVNGKILVVTLQPIKPGDQLLVDYGSLYFSQSTEHLFLNPEDSWLSPAETLKQHQSKYSTLEEKEIRKKLGELLGININSRTIIHIPRLINTLTSSSSATRSTYAHDPISGDLPILVGNRSGVYPQQEYISPLMLMCYLGRADAVNLLISQKVNVNHQSATGLNALMCVMLSDTNDDEKIAMLTALINAGADAFALDINHKSLLYYCIELNRPKVFRELIKLIIDKANFFYSGKLYDDLVKAAEFDDELLLLLTKKKKVLDSASDSDTESEEERKSREEKETKTVEGEVEAETEDKEEEEEKKEEKKVDQNEQKASNQSITVTRSSRKRQLFSTEVQPEKKQESLASKTTLFKSNPKTEEFNQRMKREKRNLRHNRKR